jgi:hypothetical protein
VLPLGGSISTPGVTIFLFMSHAVHVHDFRCFYSSGSTTLVVVFYFRIDVIFVASFFG